MKVSDKFNIIIVEDEIDQRILLLQTLDELGHKVVGMADNLPDAIGLAASTPCDLFILDIFLNGQEGGIQISKTLQQLKIHTPIIFLTSSEDSAVFREAIKSNPAAYLSKPFRKMELSNTIDLIMEKTRNTQQHSEIINKTRHELLDDGLFIVRDQSFFKVLFSDILYISVSDRLCQIHTHEKGKTYWVQSSLGKLLEQMNCPDIQPVHRNTAVNIRHIQEFSIKERYIILDDNEKIDVSRSCAYELEKKLNMIR
ncbi:MAG: LytR/AlgR family response regulator transcription factor [Bacteroidia bacterium]